jgi:hypothetical protein
MTDGRVYRSWLTIKRNFPISGGFFLYHTGNAALAEDFLNAFYALIPWDNYYIPEYLDKYLIDISKKPKNIILIKS